MRDVFTKTDKAPIVYTAILCLFAFVFPVYTWAGNWCLTVLVAFWLMRGCEWRNRKAWSRLQWVFVAYFSLHVLALLYTDNLSSGLVDLGSKASMLIAPLVFCTIRLSKSQLQKILKCFVAGVLLASVLYLVCATYLYFFLEAESHVFFYSYLALPLGNHPAYAASYSILGIVFLIEKLFDPIKRSKISWTLHIAAILLLWLMVILFVSRMQVLALCLVISGLFLWKFGIQKRWLLAAIAVLLTWGGTYYGSKAFPYTSVRVSNAVENVNMPSNVRFELWDSGFAIAKKEPVLGVGPGDLKDLLVQDYKKKDEQRSTGLAKLGMNTHSQYMESLAGLGFVGLLAFLLTLVLPSWRALKNQNTIVLAFFAIVGFGCLTECMLEVQRGSVWFAVFGSLFWHREDFLNE